MTLSEHFRLAEFTRSETATRLDIPNDPPADAISRLRDLCIYVLEPLRDLAGPITVTSGYRSPQVNASVGSKPTSQHLLGQAADIVSPILPEDRLMELAVSLPVFDQVIREFPPGGWVHISYVHEGPNRKQSLIIDRTGTRRYST